MNNIKDDHQSFFSLFELAKQKREELITLHPEFEQLSIRELEVFSYLLSDQTQDEIAKELFISGSSVHFHCKNIYKKLGVTGRRQILIKYKDL